jgi:hypothetical protein
MAGEVIPCLFFKLATYLMAINTFAYSLKVWLTSISIAPISFLVFLFYTDPPNFEKDLIGSLSAIILMHLVIILLEFIFSFITWLIFWLTIYLITISSIQTKNKIWAIFIAGICLSTATGLVMSSAGFFGSDYTLLSLTAGNCVCI